MVLMVPHGIGQPEFEATLALKYAFGTLAPYSLTQVELFRSSRFFSFNVFSELLEAKRSFNLPLINISHLLVMSPLKNMLFFFKTLVLMGCCKEVAKKVSFFVDIGRFSFFLECALLICLKMAEVTKITAVLM